MRSAIQSCHHPFHIPPYLLHNCFYQQIKIMFRRQLLRQGRAISESISRPVTFSQRATFSHASSSALLQSLRTSSIPSQQFAQRRWQSTEAEKKDTPAEDAKTEEAAKEDPSKAELEKKNKEIVDLKVSIQNQHRMASCFSTTVCAL